MVFRVYVEKRGELAHEAMNLFENVRGFLGISALESVRILNRYDVEGIGEDLFESAVKTVFSEPQVDDASADYDANLGAEGLCLLNLFGINACLLHRDTIFLLSLQRLATQF